ncbi:hypothetical protein ACWECC_34330, partial [Streptomyces microflavus]
GGGGWGRTSRGPFRGVRRARRLPPPFAGWSDSRDTEAPPRQTFRAWFASDEGRAALREAADEHDGSHAEHDPGDEGHDHSHGEGEKE